MYLFYPMPNTVQELDDDVSRYIILDIAYRNMPTAKPKRRNRMKCEQSYASITRCYRETGVMQAGQGRALSQTS